VIGRERYTEGGILRERKGGIKKGREERRERGMEM